MEHLSLSKLLERFKKKLFEHDAIKQIIQEVVLKETKILVTIEAITIKNGIILIQERPHYKNEIFLKKECILLSIKELSGNTTIVDIR